MASSKSRIAELAAAVAHHTNRVDTYLAENGLAYPSFEVDSLVEWKLPPEIEESRSQALEASQELNDLLQGPRGLIFDHQKMVVVAYLELISRFDIASKVPIDGEVSFASLADMLGFNCAAVTSILRLGIAHRMFREPRRGFIAHSAVSRQLAVNTGIASWIRNGVDDMWPACQKIVDALIKWPRAEEPNQTAFSLAHGTDQSFYSELGKDPTRARRFGEAMSAYIKGDEFSVRHVTDGYGWESIGAGGTVVDLGGSHGDVAFALARKFPGLHLIVQELPQVVANSKPEDGLHVQFMVHDIFEEQPVHNADVYLFRWILHNWPDSYCIRALRALIPALKPQARVLVVDSVMPPPGLLPNLLDRKARSMDFMMLALCNARERTLEEWTTLFAQADPRLNFRGVKQPPGSRLSILEVVWEG